MLAVHRYNSILHRPLLSPCPVLLSDAAIGLMILLHLLVFIWCQQKWTFTIKLS